MKNSTSLTTQESGGCLPVTCCLLFNGHTYLIFEEVNWFGILILEKIFVYLSLP